MLRQAASWLLAIMVLGSTGVWAQDYELSWGDMHSQVRTTPHQQTTREAPAPAPKAKLAPQATPRQQQVQQQLNREIARQQHIIQNYPAPEPVMQAARNRSGIDWGDWGKKPSIDWGPEPCQEPHVQPEPSNIRVTAYPYSNPYTGKYVPVKTVIIEELGHEFRICGEENFVFTSYVEVNMPDTDRNTYYRVNVEWEDGSTRSWDYWHDVSGEKYVQVMDPLILAAD